MKKIDDQFTPTYYVLNYWVYQRVLRERLSVFVKYIKCGVF